MTEGLHRCIVLEAGRGVIAQRNEAGKVIAPEPGDVIFLTDAALNHLLSEGLVERRAIEQPVEPAKERRSSRKVVSK